LGVNYPWVNYAHDFGGTAWGHDGVSAEKAKQEVDTDFAYLKRQGVHIVRWFLFGDGRAAPEFDADGNATGFDQYVYPDLDCALSIAEKHGIGLILVLFDFHLADKPKNENGVQLGGRARLLIDAARRKTLIEKALVPLLTRYGKNSNILAWEVINEPEGAMAIQGGKWVAEPVSVAAMQGFVEDIVECIHSHSSQWATVGSASRKWLDYWRKSGLDLYQCHYYDKMEDESPLDYPCAGLRLDKPCIVGEFPTKNANRLMTAYLDTIRRNGYAGALAWSYGGKDEASDFEGGAEMFRAWSNGHVLGRAPGARQVR